MDIQALIQPYVDRMGKAIEDVDFSNKELYANFLAQTYYYVAHSTKFLAFSAGLMGPEDRKYFNRFIKHISEENGHDLMAQKDLKNIGHELKEFPETPETRMLWESQYYKIQHLDAISLIGYIIPLEMLSAQYFPDFNKRVESVYGKKATSFVRVHAEEDEDHIEKAFKVLYDLSIERQEVIIKNMTQTAIAYTAMIENLSMQPVDCYQALERTHQGTRASSLEALRPF
jgi:hypothetical protein